MRGNARAVWVYVKKVARFVFLAILALSSATIAGAMAWVALSDRNRPKELDLIAVLAITIAAIVIASFVVTFVHKSINPEASNEQNGIVLRESILRFTWLAAPIAASYGLAQVATDIVTIVFGG